MHRALQLAKLGLGKVSPNPMVGCVIVYENRIIGEGFHREYGGPHAEVNAINSVRNKELLSNSTLYVTLEPCSHVGKTPPCADLIIKHSIPRVVVATKDLNPLVSGRGLKRLVSKGVRVVEDVLGVESRELNRRFFTYFSQKRPYVILKWAQTKNDFVARADYSSKWISTPTSRQLVHKWRSEEDSIMVGRTTAETDDPSLTVRDWKGKNPTRIVIDPQLRLPLEQMRLASKEARLIVFNSIKEEGNVGIDYIKISSNNMAPQMMKKLYELEIQSLFVEGGAHTIGEIIKEGCWDEARVFISDSEFKEGIKAPVLELNPTSISMVSTDILKFYKNAYQ